MTLRSSAQTARSGNSLLNALPITEYESMLEKMEVVKLRFNAVLYARGDAIRQIYFPIGGLVSLLMVVDDHSMVDVGVVGREGMIGLSLFLGVAKSMGRAVVQGTGEALRITAADFTNECGRGGALQRVMLRYTRSMLFQIAQSMACYRFHTIEKRLCGRLLTISQRIGSDQFPMTHDLLSRMLGARREGITIAIGVLEKDGLITTSRGKMSITNSTGLAAIACNCFQIVRNEERDSSVMIPDGKPTPI